MRRGWPAVAVALTATGLSAPPAAAEVSVRVMTYNVHWGEGVSAATGRRTGRIELGRVARDIRRSGAEVVSLQEAQSYRLRGGAVLSEPRAIARALGWTRGGVGRHYLFRGGLPAAKWCRRPLDGMPVVRRIGGRRARCVRHGNALLSRRPLTRKRSFSLWRGDGDSSDGDALGTFEGRVLVGARIRIGGLPLSVWGTHLAREPEIAACQLASTLELVGRGGPAVLLGDLNLSARTRTVPRCPEAPERPFVLLRAAGFRERGRAPLTYPAHDPARAADHVLTRDVRSIGTARALSNCRRLRAREPRICSSDHRPLVARLVIGR